MTPLHEAVRKGHIEFAELLLSFGANPDTSLKDGTTPLHTATMTKNGDMVLLLIQYNAKLNAKISAGCPAQDATAMDIAKKYRSEEIIKILNKAFELDRKQQNSIDDEKTSTSYSLMTSEDNTANDLYYLGLPNPQLFDENNYLS